jgi:hypothetical protein
MMVVVGCVEKMQLEEERLERMMVRVGWYIEDIDVYIVL